MATSEVKRMDGYDVVIASAGTTACVLAKELSRMGKKVICLEKGDDSRFLLNGTAMSMVAGKHAEMRLPKSMFVPTKEGDDVIIPFGLGGGSKTYAGLATTPDYEQWRKWGIDLEPYRAWAEEESWVADVPEEFISDGEKLYMEAAEKVGFPMEITQKHIKFDRCTPKGCAKCSYGCPSKAKWDATYSAYEAMDNGAEFLWHTTVQEAIIENGKAVGFRAKKKDGTMLEVRGKAAVVSCGGYGSVPIARKAGLKDAGTTFAGDASVLTWGILPKGMKGNQHDFPMVAQMHYEPTQTRFGSCMHTQTGWLGTAIFVEGIKVLKYLPAWPRILVSFAKTHDDALGYVGDDGSMSKTYSETDKHRLDFARETSTKILIAAGCDPKSISHNKIILAHPSATVPMGRFLDSNLEVKGVPGLYFCDTSAFPESIGAPTVLTLVHLAKHLSDHLQRVL